MAAVHLVPLISTHMARAALHWDSWHCCLCSGRAKLGILFEQWASCEGHWTESKIYIELKVSTRHRKIGARRWFTKHELYGKFGVRVADRIVATKENDKELSKTQCRFHPDAPNDEDTSLQLKSYMQLSYHVHACVFNFFFLKCMHAYI